MALIHHYNPITFLYVHSTNASLSPKDLAEGREVYLVPAGATQAELPALGENQQARYSPTTDSWISEDKPPANFVEVVTSVRIYLNTLRAAIIEDFPASIITVSPEANTELATEKTVRIDNISATDENIAMVEAIITAHDYATGKLDWVRAERTSRILATEWIRFRHNDELQLVAAELRENTTLSTEQYLAWLSYWQELRDFPSVCDPTNLDWPTEPG